MDGGGRRFRRVNLVGAGGEHRNEDASCGEAQRETRSPANAEPVQIRNEASQDRRLEWDDRRQPQGRIWYRRGARVDAERKSRRIINVFVGCRSQGSPGWLVLFGEDERGAGFE